MKYIDADKLKKSISNYIEGARAALNPTDGDADYYKGKIDACKDIQEFIGSLQQEQSEVGLEKEIDEWLKGGPITDTRYDDYCDADIKETARHFYEFGLNAKDSTHKIKGWVARDKSGDLYFFHYDCKPHRTDGIFHSECSEDVFHIDNFLFPEVDWQTEPIEVELTISLVKTE